MPGIAAAGQSVHVIILGHPMQAQSTLDPKAKHSIRYLSLHDNRYLKFFPGHTKPVTALSMSAKSDHFISTGMVRPTNAVTSSGTCIIEGTV